MYDSEEQRSLPELRTTEARLLKTDIVLSEEQERQMREILKEEERELEVYKEQLSRLQQPQETERVARRKLELQQNMDRRRSVISAIRRIPVEIWRIIFSMVCLSDGYSIVIDPNCEVGQRIPMAARLSHVCGHWRRIAMRYAQIWSSLRIRLVNYPTTTLNALSRFLRDSQLHPLTLELWRSSAHQRGAEKVFRTLGPHFVRVEALVIDIPSDEPLTLPEYIFKEKPISFRALSTYDGPFIKVLGQAMFSAPKLLSITTPDVIPLFGAPYPCLATLRLRGFKPHSLHRLFAILPHCRQLEYLSFLGLRVPEDFRLQFIPRPALLSSLRTFIIAASSDEWGSDVLPLTSDVLKSIFQALNAPNLVTFKLQTAEKWHGTMWPNELICFLGQCSASLEVFSLYIRRYSAPVPIHTPLSLSTLLGQTPNLTTFDLIIQRHRVRELGWTDYNAPFIYDLFRGLADSSRNVIPLLSTLSLKMSDISLDNDMMDTILSAVAKRNKDASGRGSTLTSLYLARFPANNEEQSTEGGSFSPIPMEISDGIVQRLHELGKDGVEVVFEDLIPPSSRPSVSRKISFGELFQGNP